MSRAYQVNGLNQYTEAGGATFDYDANGNQCRLHHHLLLRPAAEAARPLQRPSERRGNNVDLVFGYNRAGQIVERSVSSDSYAAPPAGSVARGYQVNGLNQYTGTTHAGAPNWSFEYDPNGNLTRSVDPAGAGTMGFVYDVENRLVSASNGASLVYDPLGRLFQVSGGASGVTRFLYDGDRMIGEYDAAGTLLKRYAHGQGADEPVMVHDGPGVGLVGRRYMLPDEKGSIMALVDADGTPSVKNRYDAWGIRGANNDGRFQYTGQAWIPELGLYYYKARLYSPFLGRFMQTDPIGYEDQMNLYAYVGNDPANLTDPSGMAGQCDTGSRISGNSAFCMVADGFALPDDQPPQSQRRPHGPWMYGGGGKGASPTIPPSLPPEIPGGPYSRKPDVPGNRAGSFQGPPQAKGPRFQAQWVPPDGQGGPKNSKGYWKVWDSNQKLQRYNNSGSPITAEQAHPSNVKENSVLDLAKPHKLLGAILCALLCESAANAPPPSRGDEDW